MFEGLDTATKSFYTKTVFLKICLKAWKQPIRAFIKLFVCNITYIIPYMIYFIIPYIIPYVIPYIFAIYSLSVAIIL